MYSLYICLPACLPACLPDIRLSCTRPRPEQDADRHALSASVYHSAIVIKEKELQNLTSYLTNIGTQSALLFGFSVAFISEVPDATPVWLLFFYYSIATVCLGANMYALTMATLCTVLGACDRVGDCMKVCLSPKVCCDCFPFSFLFPFFFVMGMPQLRRSLSMGPEVPCTRPLRACTRNEL